LKIQGGITTPLPPAADVHGGGARAFKVERLNLKVGGPKFFIDFSPEKACRVYAITSINNSLMQSDTGIIFVAVHFTNSPTKDLLV